MLLRQRTEFVEVIFEPVGKEQRVAVARQPEGRAARRARLRRPTRAGRRQWRWTRRRAQAAAESGGSRDHATRATNSSPAAPDGCIVRSCRPSPAGAMSRITRRSEQSGSSATSSVAARGNPQTSGAAPAARNTAAVEPHERQRPGKRRVGDRDAGAVGARQPGHHRAKDLRLVHVDSPSLRYRPDRNARSGSGGDGLPGGLPRLDS